MPETNLYVFNHLDTPDVQKEDAAPMLRIHNRMLRARIMKLREDKDCAKEEWAAFQLLRDGLLGVMNERKSHPLNVYSIRCMGRSLCTHWCGLGGWTDTPPLLLCWEEALSIFAIELNDQPPLQSYVKPCKEYPYYPSFHRHGCDRWYEVYEVRFTKRWVLHFHPKAALTLAGFAPAFSTESTLHPSQTAGSFRLGNWNYPVGTIPAGSGLGTNFYPGIHRAPEQSMRREISADWLGTKNDICSYISIGTTATTGGGWQDHGGVFSGIKLLQSEPGFLNSIH